ncbi:MAG TPA: hypothetical protein VF460_10420 [Burkholderiales bacterium]
MHPLLASLIVLPALASSAAALACGELLKGEMITAQRDLGATPAGESRTYHVLGAGWFRAVEVVKQGGASDDTAVTLELDGVPVISTTFAALKNPWMQLETPLMGAKVLSEGDTSTLTVWYSQELKFTTMAAVRIEVREEGVADLRTRTVMNKPAPHEHLAGQAIGTTATAALPAFK